MKMRSLLELGLLLACLPGRTSANPNGLGRLPPLGWCARSIGQQPARRYRPTAIAAKAAPRSQSGTSQRPAPRATAHSAPRPDHASARPPQSADLPDTDPRRFIPRCCRNTWCTSAGCDQPQLPSFTGGLHDNCSEALVKSVATAMLSNGMKEAGYNRINLDDCWGATNLEGNRADHGKYTWSPKRFPSGIPALTAWLHERGFLFGLYTSSGNQTCSSGERAGFVPGSCQSSDPNAGESDCEFDQDAATFASWGVDYVKLDWCMGKKEEGNATTKLTTDAVRERRTGLMAKAMNATGRPMWLTFHCVWEGAKKPGAETCSFLRRYSVLKTIRLTRQAREKHRKVERK